MAPAPNWSGAFAGTFPALKVALATAMLTVALPLAPQATGGDGDAAAMFAAPVENLPVKAPKVPSSREKKHSEVTSRELPSE